jgi:hypothetical protein
MRTHSWKQPKHRERESHHCRVVAAKVRKYLKSGCLDRLVPTKTQVDEAQVKPVGVVQVW